ncbi:hypothetical protein ACIQWR_37545 [Streptomyces sp. NPDC098789]
MQQHRRENRPVPRHTSPKIRRQEFLHSLVQVLGRDTVALDSPSR